jgi:hypothetical protein
MPLLSGRGRSLAADGLRSSQEKARTIKEEALPPVRPTAMARLSATASPPAGKNLTRNDTVAHLRSSTIASGSMRTRTWGIHRSTQVAGRRFDALAALMGVRQTVNCEAPGESQLSSTDLEHLRKATCQLRQRIESRSCYRGGTRVRARDAPIRPGGDEHAFA